uniref:Uncharacterized protein n=1 Tax=viral metagenome TaxID=1070528 RepID=A0A6C0F8M1_9ZZZZ|tara:strand:- start:37733 stop:38704 length:972 start_codon:yes stop_codon:yes gene_type:complete
MSNQHTLIHKYRPYTLNDFTDNDTFKNIIKTLNNMNNLNVLFIGNSCSGKTTLLDCIVRDYYQLTKNQSIKETNVLFINNLKDQGIQYFRNEMKIFCQSTCSIRNKKKIIIIDDLDSINEQSQQVFRNYIDKYSKNIHFLSVCTTVQKVIESLQSRLHIIKLPTFSDNYCINLFDTIVKNEKIKLDKKSKEYVLSISNNSVRTLINNLEKLYIYNNSIKLEICKDLCNTISFEHFDNYYNFLKDDKILEAIKLLNNVYDYGYSVIDILDYLFYYTKITDLLNEKLKYEIVIILCNYISIFHSIHEDPIELSLITYDISKLFKI